QDFVRLDECFGYIDNFKTGNGKRKKLSQLSGDVFVHEGPRSLSGIVFKFNDILPAVTEENFLRSRTSSRHCSDVLNRSNTFRVHQVCPPFILVWKIEKNLYIPWGFPANVI